MTDAYARYENLESFSAEVAKNIKNGERKINFLAQAELEPQSVKKYPLTDVTARAKKWAQKEVPDDLIFNHGYFIGEGMKHLISELENKPDSNRALYSLINQKDIDGRGDEPIPSFMVFQCVVVDNILYCTAYFRALEVCNFLRINIEEMRLNICDILDSVKVELVRLSIFTFSAYSKPNQIPLEKCRLDRLSALALADRYTNDFKPLADLIDEKSLETTAVIDSGLNAINEWLADDRKEKWPKGLNVIPVRQAIGKALEAGSRLRAVRKKFSYETEISTEYVESIKKIAKEFRK